MRKLIAAINMTLDGFCDHTTIAPDAEIHAHYSELLKTADTIVYGRITYQLMEYWREVLENPTGNKAMDEFARTIDDIPEKVVFSNTLTEVTWKGARIAGKGIREEMQELKRKPGKNILVGSPGLIIACLNLGLVDEFQLCVHPVIVGSGMQLFKKTEGRKELKLLKTKTFGSGAVTFYYSPSE